MFEQYGKPALVVCTEPFKPTADNIAKVLGIPGYRYSIVEHPIGSRTEAEIDELAEIAYEQGVQYLTESDS